MSLMKSTIVASSDPVIMSAANLAEEVEMLQTAEDFLDFFAVSYEPRLVKVNRINLLRLFNLNLAKKPSEPTWDDYQKALLRAYCLLENGVKAEFAKGGCHGCNECD